MNNDLYISIYFNELIMAILMYYYPSPIFLTICSLHTLFISQRSITSSLSCNPFLPPSISSSITNLISLRDYSIHLLYHLIHFLSSLITYSIYLIILMLDYNLNEVSSRFDVSIFHLIKQIYLLEINYNKPNVSIHYSLNFSSKIDFNASSLFIELFS